MEPRQSRAKPRSKPEDEPLSPQGAGAVDHYHRAPTDILTINPIRLAYRLNYVANFYSGPLYKEVEQRWGLSRPDFITLFCLLQLPGLLARDIVEICGRPKNSISRAVNGLLTQGYIRREDADGGRGQPLFLTAAGEAVAREIVPLFVSREARMLEPLTEVEREMLGTILSKLCLRRDGWNSTY